MLFRLLATLQIANTGLLAGHVVFRCNGLWMSFTEFIHLTKKQLGPAGRETMSRWFASANKYAGLHLQGRFKRSSGLRLKQNAVAGRQG